MRLFSLFFIFCAFIFTLNAQQFGKNNQKRLIHVPFQYGFHFSAGDLSERFGTAMSVGSGITLIQKNNLIFTGQANYYFGSGVKEDVLANLRTPEGYIIGNNKVPADVVLKTRAWDYKLGIGKIFPFHPQKSRTGLLISIATGVFSHKIRIQDNSRSVAQLTGDYLKGYDRLSSGISLSQTIGYQYFSPKSNASFFIGLELEEALTKNKRNWNFDTNEKDETQRIDILGGFKIGFSLPFVWNRSGEAVEY